MLCPAAIKQARPLGGPFAVDLLYFPLYSLFLISLRNFFFFHFINIVLNCCNGILSTVGLSKRGNKKEEGGSSSSIIIF